MLRPFPWRGASSEKPSSYIIHETGAFPIVAVQIEFAPFSRHKILCGHRASLPGFEQLLQASDTLRNGRAVKEACPQTPVCGQAGRQFCDLVVSGTCKRRRKWEFWAALVTRRQSLNKRFIAAWLSRRLHYSPPHVLIDSADRIQHHSPKAGVGRSVIRPFGSPTAES